MSDTKTKLEQLEASLEVVKGKLTQVAAVKTDLRAALVEKGQDPAGVVFSGWPDKVRAISSASATTYTVTYYDYDGTALKEQSVESGGTATPPSNPSHAGLTFQEWNKGTNGTITNVTRNMEVGAIYTTTDGNTHAHVRLTAVTGLSLTVCLQHIDNGGTGSTLSIDWGDSSEVWTSTESGYHSATHSYAQEGDYIVKVWLTGDGSYAPGHGNQYTTFIGEANLLLQGSLFRLHLGSAGLSPVINSHAFYDNSSLRYVTIPNPITDIGESTFNFCYSLAAAMLPSTVTTISTRAFYGCYSATAIPFGVGVHTIGNDAFRGCYNLSIVDFTNVSLSLGTAILHSVRSLSSVYFPENAPGSSSELPASLCYGCMALSRVDIPAWVTTIGNYCFYSCASLQEVNIPDDSYLLAVGTQAFLGCYALTEIDLSSDLSSVTTFGISAFQNCSSLTAVVIAAGTSEIPDSCFSSCGALKSVTFESPDSIMRIGTSAFLACYALESLPEFTNPELTIASSAFRLCYSLREFSWLFPAAVQATTFSGCPAISEYVFDWQEVVPLSATTAFQGISPLTKIYVPDALVGPGGEGEEELFYKSATNWSSYANYIYPLSEKPA